METFLKYVLMSMEALKQCSHSPIKMNCIFVVHFPSSVEKCDFRTLAELYFSVSKNMAFSLMVKFNKY